MILVLLPPLLLWRSADSIVPPLTEPAPLALVGSIVFDTAFKNILLSIEYRLICSEKQNVNLRDHEAAS